MFTLNIRKVEFLQVPGAKPPTTLWLGYRGFFSRPLLRVPLCLERCCFWPEPHSGQDAYVLMRHMFDGDSLSNSFRVVLGKGGCLKVKLLRGRRKVAKLTVAVEDLLSMTALGPAKLQFSSYHPLGDALVAVECTNALCVHNQILQRIGWFTAPTSPQGHTSADEVEELPSASSIGKQGLPSPASLLDDDKDTWVAAAQPLARGFLRQEHQTLAFFSFVLRLVMPINILLLVWGELEYRQVPASLACLTAIAAALLAHAAVRCYLRSVCGVSRGRVGGKLQQCRGGACGQGWVTSCYRTAPLPLPYGVRLPSMHRRETLPRAWQQHQEQPQVEE